MQKLNEMNLLTIGSENDISPKAVTVYYPDGEDYVSIVGFNFKDLVSISEIVENMVGLEEERYTGIEERENIFVQNINTKNIFDKETGLKHTEIGDSVEELFGSWKEFKEYIKLNSEVC